MSDVKTLKVNDIRASNSANKLQTSYNVMTNVGNNYQR